jgi:hypothetical protein
MHAKNLLGVKAVLGLCTALFLLSASPSFAAGKAEEVSAALNRGDFAAVKTFIAANPGEIDEAVRAILVYARTAMAKEPGRAAEAAGLAEGYADKITPPGVPMICSNVREMVQALPASSKEKSPSLYASVLSASQSFAKAPVVVAAGRPNLCEDAWLEDAELAQTPNYALPGLPTRLPQPPHHPDDPSSPQ